MAIVDQHSAIAPESQHAAFSIPETLRPVGAVTIHLIVGALAFVAVIAVAIGLAGIVHLLAMIPFAPTWLPDVADLIEKVLFGADLLTVGAFLLKEIGKFLRALMRDWANG